ncbi:extracellular solute-binding protein [Gracilibacillus salinarum]|uniref:Extracellular solute-binding protein n=1 Tax=Gracilibacillus salinarum TaxID=2932255 RepID=A0ABY4GM16_9BACI|nr:extracellular solute-binding protein [Gracilibacillus salinarum]UOQ85259.1 extracellular solute-binding protein [Gracilibacillus salinarum]
MKKSSFILLTALSASLLTACGNIDEQQSSVSNKEEEVIIKIAWWGEQNRTDYTLEVIELFEEKHPGVHVEAEYAGWSDYWRRLAPQAAANELPDIIQMDLSYLTQYAESNQIADLSPYIGKQINIDHISDNAVSGGKINGGIFGFNLGYTTSAYYYNASILEEIGVDRIPVEWTWKEYKDFSVKAAEAGYATGEGVGETQVLFDYYLRTKGAKLFATGGSELGYEDDQFFIDFYAMQKQLIEIGAAPTPDQTAQRTGPEEDPLGNGESFGGVGWAAQFQAVQQHAEDRLDLHVPPVDEDGTNGLYLKPSMFFSIAKQSEHKELAAEFINFFVNNEQANELILADRGIPVSSEIKQLLREKVPEAQAEVFDYISWAEHNSQPMGGADPAFANEVIEVLQHLAEQIVYGQKTVEDAAKEFRIKAESILSQ